MTFRLFSQAVKPSSSVMSGVIEVAIGEEDGGLKKELIFDCIA